ncbi:MAG: nitrilase-related carbon-nitrogen hydrolase [Polyangia bacterium]
MSALRIAGVQLDVAWEDRRANRERVSSLAAEARRRGARVLVLPEMFATGFSLDPELTAEPPDGETPEFLRELARRLRMVVVGGYVRREEDGRGSNLALAVDEAGETLAEYAKSHLFGFMGEQRVHRAGDGPRPFAIDGVGAACFVCYDLRFCELFRLVAERTALVLVIASWPSERQAHWDLLLRARAVENQQYVVGVNRVGSGGGLEYGGGSAVIDPLGRVAAHGGEREGLVVADVDPELVAEVRKKMPFLADRRF